MGGWGLGGLGELGELGGWAYRAVQTAWPKEGVPSELQPLSPPHGHRDVD